MSNSPTPATPTADNTGRDTQGRFAPGNVGGPGNPFARQVAELRSVLLECVTKEDMKFIAEQLVILARTGDLAATKLLFQYVLGKPAATVNPDTLDYQELAQYQQAPTPEDLRDIQGRMPVGATAAILRYTQPCKDQQMREALVGGLRRMDEAEEAGEVIDPLEIAEDAIEEVLGRTPDDLGDFEACPPSANGEMHDDPRPSVPPLPHEKTRTGPKTAATARNGTHAPHGK